MSLLLLLFPTQAPPAQPGYINLSLAEQDLWPALNATSPADAIFWEQSEIYQWFDDAAKRLARKSGMFVVYDQTTGTTINVASYAVPASFINALQADLNGTVLKARSVMELEALDSTWPVTTGTPDSFVLDTQGLELITLYPTSVPASGTVGLVMGQDPPDISVSAALLNAPPVFREYFTFYAIAEARARESNAQMPEVSKWLRGIVDMMDQAIASTWQ